MDKIKSKQVEGVVDKHSDQSVTGNKTINGSLHFPGPDYTLSIFEDKLYWVINQGVYDEPGNMRAFGRDGRFVIEIFDGTWIEQASL